MNSNFGENPLSNYEKKDTIGMFQIDSGKGAYGLVYKAVDLKNNEYVAVKKVLI